MAKITFVYPDYESLGVAYLMAACIRAGYDVELVFYVTGESFIDIFKKSGVAFSDIAEKVVATKPDIVAFSCMTDFYQAQLMCANAIKEIIPKVVTIFGGIHPTAVPELVLKEKNVDCVAIGEAEESFIAFLNECQFTRNPILPQHKVDGIVFKLNDNLIGDFREGKLPDLNALAFPYKKPFYDSFNAFSNRYSILTSRGCPFSCSYCFSSSMNYVRGKSIVRQRTVDNVILELLQAKHVHAPKNIFFADDCFTTNEAWLIEFCNRYKKEIKIPFGCAAIPSYLNKTKVQALRDAGCCQVQIGVQSLNENLCKEVLLRKSDNVKIAEAICLLKDAGITVQADHILGIPGDTLSMEEENVLFYNKFRPNVVSVYWLTYYPKTKIVETARQKGILNAQDIDAINNGTYSGATKAFSLSRTNSEQHRLYYGIDFVLNFLPFLPRWLVRLSIKRKAYKICSFKSIFFRRLLKLLSNFIIVLFQPKNFIYRSYFFLALNKMFYKEKVMSKK